MGVSNGRVIDPLAEDRAFSLLEEMKKMRHVKPDEATKEALWAGTCYFSFLPPGFAESGDVPGNL